MENNRQSLLQKMLHLLRATMFSAGSYQLGTITILAALVGVIGGYAAIGFYLAIDLLLEIGFGSPEASLATGVAALPAWKIILIPVAGGLIVGQLLRFIDKKQSKSVSHVIESAALENGKINAKEGFLSAAITVISLGSGASAGREGPVVHLGATLASLVTSALRLNAATARTLLGCGVAAAVAASFNAPIAGVFFALEVIIGHYALHAFAPIVIAAIAGTLVSRSHLGDFPAFQITDYFINSFWEFPAFFLLGIVAAFVSIVFMSGMNWSDRKREWMSKYPYWLQPATAGLLVGIIAVRFPEILSVGYEAISKALNGQYGFQALLALLGIKIVATIISYTGRFGGGVFSPSLFIGAMTGGAFGIAAASIFPDLASSPGLYAIVGMGAVASAVLGAPISTMLIVFEITGDYNVTVAVMIASAVASNFTSLYYKRSFFLMQLADRGIELEGGKATYLLKSAKVEDHMSRDFYTVLENEPAIKARELLVAQGGGILIVTDQSGKMLGTLGFAEFPPDIFERATAEDHLVSEFLRSAVTSVHTNDPLQAAMTALDTSGDDVLPVLSVEQEGTVVGIITDRHVMREYNRALLESQGQDQSA
ncbi:MAG: chloride channel protein [Kordiimonadaceae bacterium]|nr:chloride channel protein [Kordiimonadaceae bacterium]